MLQLVYISSAATGTPVDLAAVLRQSQRNNLRDGVTGLLFADGKRFLQALEGPAAVVTATYARIEADPRHRAVVLLHRRETTEREFGPWAMALRTPGTARDEFIDQVDALCRNASPAVRGIFHGLVEARNAA